MTENVSILDKLKDRDIGSIPNPLRIGAKIRPERTEYSITQIAIENTEADMA